MPLPSLPPLPRWLRLGLSLIALAVCLPVLAVLAVYLQVAPQLPQAAELREMRLTTPMQVYTRDGKLMAVFGDKRRIPVRYEQIPPLVVNAFIAVEDQRFFQHGGVDMWGLLRIAVSNLTNDRAEGASTITMQVARNYFLSRERTLARKFTEIFLALRIEDEFDKQAIMEMYLNKIHFSHKAYGVAAAAQVYYGKTLDQLELHEIAVLAGIPKGESDYNPISNPKKATARRNHVLNRMRAENFINEEQLQQALAVPVVSSYHGPRVELEAPYLAEMVRQSVVQQLGEQKAYEDGVKVWTTAPADVQLAANAALLNGLRDYDRRHGYRGPEQHWPAAELAERDTVLTRLAKLPVLANEPVAVVTQLTEQDAKMLLADGSEASLALADMAWARQYIDENRMGPALKSVKDVLDVGDVIRIEQLPASEDKPARWALGQVPKVGGALIALAPKTGAVLALVGGLDFEISQFNRVTQARRQPGSNLKPFVYSAALDNGFSPATIINDAPIINEDNGEDETWRPENDAGRYLGPIRLRVALTRSTNSVSIRLFQALGPDTVIAHLKKFGFPEAQLPPYPALALGGASEITPWELVRGYAILANGGLRVEPWFISRVEDGAGNTLREVLPPAGERVLDVRNAYLMTDIMKDVIHRGTALPTLVANKSPLLLRTDLAGKTGTTNESREAWFSGYNPDIVASAYVGFDDHSKALGRIEYGGKAALPIWQQFMETVLVNLPIAADLPPPGIVAARIDAETGLLAASTSKTAVQELFMAEHAPTETAPANADENPDVFNNPNEPDQPASTGDEALF
ncbi:penicillin-binding protein 1A [Permianibacter sp. IMCC34836]|uniref:penicillin-binding protein 1A n=1 Tax=Permianibacter fluminis TaxID=2738515 RepID=UPI001554436E|nr:penicillin-binding protein 1A [Permianibacter fluminis]NQD36290.1 penicillin-binding protein 1A [Permianibacter fluminis]